MIAEIIMFVIVFGTVGGILCLIVHELWREKNQSDLEDAIQAYKDAGTRIVPLLTTESRECARTMVNQLDGYHKLAGQWASACAQKERDDEQKSFAESDAKFLKDCGIAEI